MPLTTSHPISGEPLIINNPLTEEHIKVGGFLWYWGFTSAGSWNCPAVITQINERRQQFRVCSLDDMREQNQWYSFRCTRRSNPSRQTMRVATLVEVEVYLDTQRVCLTEQVTDAKAEVTRAEASLARFDEFVRSIVPTT